jgi:hypothetical protein
MEFSFFILGIAKAIVDYIGGLELFYLEMAGDNAGDIAGDCRS